MNKSKSLLENEWYIQAPWGKIAIIAWGDCYDPPVLLVPGLLDSAVSFRPLVNLLPRNFYYIGIELPGNGKSDSFPPGLMLSVHDIAYSIHSVVRHFRWQSFVYIGHSAGSLIGKMYNLFYPGNISKLIELDPINLFAIPPEDFTKWYHHFFTDFYKEYDNYNSPKEKAPRIKWQEALNSMKNNRPSLNDEQVAAVLERISEPAGEGFLRYTFDRRMKRINTAPFTPEHIKTVITSTTTPILTIPCKESLDKKLFRNTAFLLDEKEYPNGNLRTRKVNGSHDVHISHPDRVAKFIGPFLQWGLEGVDGKTASKL